MKSKRKKDFKTIKGDQRSGLFNDYIKISNIYDELFDGARDHEIIKSIFDFFSHIDLKEFSTLHFLAEKILRERGVSFKVYHEQNTQDHTFPFDLMPRIITHNEWALIERGLRQRVYALNAFLKDVYGSRLIIKDKVIPLSIVESSSGFNPLVRDIMPPGGVFIHISGIDLIRDHQGKLLILEDNLRVPSGVSYALANREIMELFFKDMFEHVAIKPIDRYTEKLHHSLTTLKNSNLMGNRLVLLTPGPYNSAYFEHKFLAEKLNCDLVQGQDLFVEHDYVYKKSDKSRVDIIYRRIDDDFLDPKVFRKESLLGVPGIFNAYKKGHVMLANAIGNGVADDKSVYPFIPNIIKYYLNEEPILPQVKTYACINQDDRNYVINNLHSLVIKLVNQSGGYGMVIGPHASKTQLEIVRHAILHNPRSYIAQPLIELSCSPTFDTKNLAMAPRRIDLRPFCLMGNDIWVIPGGLTRVALKSGSYVVNSSQGGGSKDTWVLE